MAYISSCNIMLSAIYFACNLITLNRVSLLLCKTIETVAQQDIASSSVIIIHSVINYSEDLIWNYPVFHKKKTKNKNVAIQIQLKIFFRKNSNVLRLRLS